VTNVTISAKYFSSAGLNISFPFNIACNNCLDSEIEFLYTY